MLLNPSLFTPPKFVILTNGGGKARGDNDCQVDVEIPIRQAASTTVSTLYSWLADWILPVSDSPSSVTAHYHGETLAPYSRGESLIRIKSSLETEGDTDVIQQSHAISIQRGGNSNGNQSLTLDFYN